MKDVYHDVKISVIDIRDADDETITPTTGVDMQGYEGVAFAAIVDGGEEVSGFSIKAQQDTASDFSVDAADLEDTSISFSSHATDEIVRVLDIGKPQERYVRPVVVIPDMTTATPVAIVAIQYGAREKPTDANTGEFHQSPDEGTA